MLVFDMSTTVDLSASYNLQYVTRRRLAEIGWRRGGCGMRACMLESMSMFDSSVGI